MSSSDGIVSLDIHVFATEFNFLQVFLNLAVSQFSLTNEALRILLSLLF